jgi:hypothetical protein
MHRRNFFVAFLGDFTRRFIQIKRFFQWKATTKNMDGSPRLQTGPPAYKNWKKALDRASLIRTSEYPMFTDAHITGQIEDGYGPYQLLNAVRIPDDRIDLPAIILRVDEYLDYTAAQGMPRTDIKNYHGGDLCDEVAALVSLSLGVRLKAGGTSRWFEPDGDPKGRPMSFDVGKNPILLKPSNWLPVLPKAIGLHGLETTTLLPKLPELLPDDASALVRAARLYQDALWVVESETALSWLMLVSALETAAGHWRSVEESPIERLGASKPHLEKILEDAGGTELVSKVADEIADYMGATKKFIDFILEFLPEPPTERPHENLQVSWNPKDMKKTMGIIYNWRSRALHGGTPFPYPMCYPPSNLLEEKPIGLAASAQGGVWVSEDIPMLLHTFEYIVRRALLQWWESMLPKS